MVEGAHLNSRGQEALRPSAEAVWQGFHQVLLAFFRKRVSDASVADDLLMEAFVRIQKGLPELNDRARLQGWIFRIARNLVTDHYRSESRDRMVKAEERELAVELPEDNVAANELGQCVLSMIEVLPAGYREILQLVEVAGLSQREAAERLGLSPSGARSKVQRGRALLRDLTSECCRVELDRRGNVLEHECQGRSCNHCGRVG